MQLRRVRIEHYRALKNVDLSFDPAFDKQIFPLGSQNGGGKSTLLQLIFTLLHCAGDPARHQYLRNLMESFVHRAEQAEELVAELTLAMEDKEIKLSFVSLGPESSGREKIAWRRSVSWSHGTRISAITSRILTPKRTLARGPSCTKSQRQRII